MCHSVLHKKYSSSATRNSQKSIKICFNPKSYVPTIKGKADATFSLGHFVILTFYSTITRSLRRARVFIVMTAYQLHLNYSNEQFAIFSTQPDTPPSPEHRKALPSCGSFKIVFCLIRRRQPADTDLALGSRLFVRRGESWNGQIFAGDVLPGTASGLRVQEVWLQENELRLIKSERERRSRHLLEFR